MKWEKTKNQNVSIDDACVDERMERWRGGHGHDHHCLPAKKKQWQTQDIVCVWQMKE